MFTIAMYLIVFWFLPMNFDENSMMNVFYVHVYVGTVTFLSCVGNFIIVKLFL